MPRKHKHKKDSSRKQAEAEAKALRAQKFDYLLEDESEQSGTVELKSKSKSSKDKHERHTRKRESSGREWEDDVEDEQVRKRLRADRHDDGRDRGGEDDDGVDMQGIEEEEDEETRKERERLEDLKERDAFAERVRQREKERTKKIVEDRSSKGGAAAEAAERRRLAEDVEARSRALPSLREHSRQEYLKKREIQQLELLRREIADDEALFHGMKMTKRERKQLEEKKRLLQLAEERLKLEDKWEGYQLPEDYFTEQGKIDKKKKENVLYKRYEEAKPKDDQFTTDVDQWEAAQTKHSTFKVGAMDKPELLDQYEYVFDESQTIQFVMDATLKGEGSMSAADRLLQERIEEAEKRGACISFWFIGATHVVYSQLRASRKLGSPCQFINTVNNYWTRSRIIRCSL